jgi:hypothetical protein
MSDHATLRTIAALHRERAGVVNTQHLPDDRKRSRLAAIDAELRRLGADAPEDVPAAPAAPVKRRTTATSAAAKTRTRRGGSAAEKE